MSKPLITLLALGLCAGIANASETPGQRPGEFAFDDLSGKQGGPNAFMKQHAIRQSWPANVDNAFRAQAAEKAAMEAPVKLLFPLICFFFPATFIVLFGPIFLQFVVGVE